MQMRNFLDKHPNYVSTRRENILQILYTSMYIDVKFAELHLDGPGHPLPPRHPRHLGLPGRGVHIVKLQIPRGSPVS